MRESRRRDSIIVFAVALLVRIGIVVWAASRFPPTADGTFYHRIAQRIAEGHGYTWLWPDGVVTYAGHYPVGYPALLGAGYALFGTHAAVAMALNAVVGSLAALAVFRLSLRSMSPRYALVAGLVVAFHPGLAAYTPALMSEGVTAALVTCAAWVAARLNDAFREDKPGFPWKWCILLGVITGLATLVRPQSIVFAPLFAFAAVFGSRVNVSWKRLATSVGIATIAAFVLVTPWTARNCARMGRCALVSYNGGWNLLIGADTASTGAWSPVKVPYECREVWDEAAKDECFRNAAVRYITSNPGEWVNLIPRKLAATFDYCGAAGWYLHESNGSACDDRCKVALGGAETVYERILLLLGIIWTTKDSWRGLRSRTLSPISWIQLAIALVGIAFVVQTHAWVSYVAFVLAALLRGRDLFRGPVLATCTVIVVAMTALIHGVFFGAGRYGMITFPLLAGVAVLALAKSSSEQEQPDVHGQAS